MFSRILLVVFVLFAALIPAFAQDDSPAGTVRGTRGSIDVPAFDLFKGQFVAPEIRAMEIDVPFVEAFISNLAVAGGGVPSLEGKRPGVRYILRGFMEVKPVRQQDQGARTDVLPSIGGALVSEFQRVLDKIGLRGARAVTRPIGDLFRSLRVNVQTGDRRVDYDVLVNLFLIPIGSDGVEGAPAWWITSYVPNGQQVESSFQRLFIDVAGRLHGSFDAGRLSTTSYDKLARQAFLNALPQLKAIRLATVTTIDSPAITRRQAEVLQAEVVGVNLIAVKASEAVADRAASLIGKLVPVLAHGAKVADGRVDHVSSKDVVTITIEGYHGPIIEMGSKILEVELPR